VVKVVAGSIDTTAAAIGSGAVDDYATHLYIGTSSWLAAHVPFKKTDVLLRWHPCHAPCRALPADRVAGYSGRQLTYLRDNILYHKDELLQEG